MSWRYEKTIYLRLYFVIFSELWSFSLSCFVLCVFLKKKRKTPKSTIRPLFYHILNEKHYRRKQRFLVEVSLKRTRTSVSLIKNKPAVGWNHFSVNWDETHASPHFKLVSTNFNAFVHCSSELNWILTEEKKTFVRSKSRYFNLKFTKDLHERLTYFIENAPPFPLESWILPFSILHNKENMSTRKNWTKWTRMLSVV